MDWVWILLGAHLLYAVVFIVDSILVKRHLKNATSYAFFVSLLGLLVFLLIPFAEFEFLSQKLLITAFISGAAFTYGTLFLYRAFKEHEASRVVPVVGGMVPVFSFLLSYIVLPEQLNSRQLIAFAVLITGTVLITYPFHKQRKHHMRPAIIGEMLLASLLFAIWGLLARRVYLETDFVNGLIWIRTGAALAGLLLLLGPRLRKEILHGKQRLKARAGSIILINKAGGAVAGLSVNYALSMGNATLVHALQGVQYVFLFGIVVFLSHWFPKVLKEDLDTALIIQKFGSTIIIAIGVALLLISSPL